MTSKQYTCASVCVCVCVQQQQYSTLLTDLLSRSWGSAKGKLSEGLADVGLFVQPHLPSQEHSVQTQ